MSMLHTELSFGRLLVEASRIREGGSQTDHSSRRGGGVHTCGCLAPRPAPEGFRRL
jgi:hypothetical protein